MKKTGKENKTLNRWLSYAAILGAVIIFVISAAQSANAVTITVMNGTDSDPGSLRAAINTANGNGTADTIVFDNGYSISLLSSLPPITEQLTIDGYIGNPGDAMPNSAAVGAAFNGTLTIELNGSSAGNSGIGLQISAANCVIRGLVINRFQNGGIQINAAGNGADIFGNFIGTNTAGTAALGNVNRGIFLIGATGVEIGGSGIDTRNIISGNSGTGVTITGGGSATFRRNLIGTARNGTTDLGNTMQGILIVDSSNSAVGTASTTRNIISGNNSNGIAIIQSSNLTTAANNSIAGNYIGVDITGNTALRNNGSGVSIQAGNNRIGGITPGLRNVISGNTANGVSISTSLATGTTVAGNYIGVGADGTADIENAQSGIRISNLANGNTIGGTGVTPGTCNASCNIIANNGNEMSIEARAGIYIDSTGGVSNAIRSNFIFNNGLPFLPPFSTFDGLGIDLGTPNVTANDADDPDTGPNDLQNFPVLSSANTSNLVLGTLDSTSDTAFALDFFLNSTADGVNSEGRMYIGSMNVSTDNNGDASFTFTSTVALPVGQFITATATSTGNALIPQAIGDTSEFSNPAQIVGATAAGVTVAGRIFSSKAQPLSGAVISLTDGDGNVLTTRSNSFGYYRFEEVGAGQTYILEVRARRYSFMPQVLVITDDLINLELFAVQ